MASAPLFVTDLATLQLKLRLSGTDTADGQALIEEAVLTVRSGFISRLGSSRVSAILLISHTDNPVSSNDVIRANAEVCEVKWNRMELLRTMPTISMDASGVTEQIWNEEGAFRATGELAKNKELNRLASDIAILLGLLEGDTDAGTVQADSIDPDPLPCFLGNSIYPWC